MIEALLGTSGAALEALVESATGWPGMGIIFAYSYDSVLIVDDAFRSVTDRIQDHEGWMWTISTGRGS